MRLVGKIPVGLMSLMVMMVVGVVCGVWCVGGGWWGVASQAQAAPVMDQVFVDSIEQVALPSNLITDSESIASDLMSSVATSVVPPVVTPAVTSEPDANDSSAVTDHVATPQYMQSPILEPDFEPKTPKDSSQQIVNDNLPIPAELLINDPDATEREMLNELIDQRLNDESGVESTGLGLIMKLSLLGLVPIALLVLLFWWKQRRLRMSRPRWLDDQ